MDERIDELNLHASLLLIEIARDLANDPSDVDVRLTRKLVEQRRERAAS